MAKKYDFGGWATRNDLKCSDGRTIRRDAFADDNGKDVPLVWNHQHDDVENVLGHAYLENRSNGVYAYCSFNDTERGNIAKECVKNGDIKALSIYANKLKQVGGDVVHGAIREVSLVLAGANPGAFIDAVLTHGENSDDEAVIYNGMPIELEVIEHSEKEEKKSEDETDKKESSEKEKETPKVEEEKKTEASEKKEETIKDVLDSMTEKQRNVTYALVGDALENGGKADDDDENEEDKEVKHNVFDETTKEENTLSHADFGKIIGLAKNSAVGTLHNAIEVYCAENDALAHSMEDTDIEKLFPDYKDVKPGAPEVITRDYTWVDGVINGASKSPFSRIRTRHTDARSLTGAGRGYKKGTKKTIIGNVKLLNRTTDPQTIYAREDLNRDDIVDITDFDFVNYMYNIATDGLKETLALAMLVGDGREDGDADKISEEYIRPIWTDDDLYAIHIDVDFAAAKKEIQGTNTSANFSEEYIYSEAIIKAVLNAKVKCKGTNLTYYTTPLALNKMLLSRDLNGRRIYNDVTDVAKALNVSAIETVEQFEGLVRTDDESSKHNLVGILVNMKDYTLGSTKGGEITKFNQFDIDFNKEKFLVETRLSGALTKAFGAIVLEEAVSTTEGE